MNNLTGARPASVTSESRQGIQVLLFGVLRERLGMRTVTVSQPANTVADIWEIIMAHHSGNLGLHDAVLCARNLEYCAWDTRVFPGDEIAFMPPVCGGSSDADAGVTVAVAEHPISVAELLAHAGVDEDGAVACFFGRVRNRSQGMRRWRSPSCAESRWMRSHVTGCRRSRSCIAPARWVLGTSPSR
jgi:molybdopterin converting factor small subunit